MPPYEALEVREEGPVAWVDEMIATSPLGLQLAKECSNASIDAGSLEQAVATEDRSQILRVQGPKMAGGVRAFFEKRTPKWS